MPGCGVDVSIKKAEAVSKGVFRDGLLTCGLLPKNALIDMRASVPYIVACEFS